MINIWTKQKGKRDDDDMIVWSYIITRLYTKHVHTTQKLHIYLPWTLWQREDKLPNHSPTLSLPSPLLQPSPPRKAPRSSSEDLQLCTGHGKETLQKVWGLSCPDTHWRSERCESFAFHTQMCAEWTWAQDTVDTWWPWKITQGTQHCL